MSEITAPSTVGGISADVIYGTKIYKRGKIKKKETVTEKGGKTKDKEEIEVKKVKQMQN